MTASVRYTLQLQAVFTTFKSGGRQSPAPTCKCAAAQATK